MVMSHDFTGKDQAAAYDIKRNTALGGSYAAHWIGQDLVNTFRRQVFYLPCMRKNVM